MRPSLLFLLLLLVSWAHAWKVEGNVFDEQGDALPFVNIFIKGTSIGTVSNEEGAFQLEIPSAEAILEFRYLGYQNHYESLSEQFQGKVIKVTMRQRAELLNEAVIDGSSNPAIPIIKQVIAHREEWDIESKDYQCEVYIKGLQHVADVPERFMGIEIEREELGLDSNGDGILYLFESINSLRFSAPKTYQEQIKSSQVSGNNKAFSYTRASDLVMDFNKNLVPFFDMERGLVSPIGGNGLFYYSYRLEGSYYEGDQRFYRIHFEPKRKNDPAGTGILIIADSLWYTQSIQCKVYRENQLSLLDSLEVDLEFQVDQGKYRPASTRMEFGLNIYKVGVSGYYITQYLSYGKDAAPTVKKRPKLEVLYIEPEATSRDSLYWAEIRPIPLTGVEQEDYHIKDSVRIYNESVADTSTRGGFGWHSLWSSTNFRNADRSKHYRVQGLLQSFQYNTVEGLVFEPKLQRFIYFKGSIDLQYFTEFKIRYGFSNTRLGLSIHSERHFKTKIPLRISSDIFHISTPIDGTKGMTPTMNSLYSLFAGENYLKFYQRTGMAILADGKVANGLSLQLGLSLEDRTPLNNTSDFSINKSVNHFTENKIINSEQPRFQAHAANLVSFGFRFTPFNRYITSPKGKIDIGSSWPEFRATYTVAIPNQTRRSAKFQKIDFRMDWGVSLGILGNTRISSAAGIFLDNSRVFAPDYFHIGQNPSFYQGIQNRMLRLQSVIPYTYSTEKGYVQIHWQHNFDGFLFNKVPGLRKIRGREFIGVQALAVPGQKPYYEFSFGIEQLALSKKGLGLMRIEFIVGTNGGKAQPAFRIGRNF